MKKTSSLTPEKQMANAGASVMEIVNSSRARTVIGDESWANVGIDAGPGNNPSGEAGICLANASRFIEANFSEPLTTFATNWKDPNRIDQALEFVAPMVSTSRRFEFAQFVNAEEFLSETDDVRGINADFARVEYTSTKVNSKTLNKGLVIRVDEDNVDDLPNWREIYTGKIMRRLLRNEYRRAMKLLIAAGSSTGFTWGAITAGLDPDQNLNDLVIAYWNGAGVGPNRILFDQTAWSKRQKAHRAQNSAGGFASAAMTPAMVAEYLGLDDAYVSRERYTTGTQLNPTKTTVTQGANTSTLTQPVVIFLAEAGQTNEDPSNIKRFVSATAGGTPFRVYEQRISAKLVDISAEHYSQIVITATNGIQIAQIT